jgi:hypothetical protein
MPGVALDVLALAVHAGQCAVGPPAGLERDRLVGRAAGQGMDEHEEVTATMQELTQQGIEVGDGTPDPPKRIAE